MKKKVFSLALSLILALSVGLFAGCETEKAQIPDFTVTDKSDVTAGSIFDASSVLPSDLSADITVSYKVALSDGTVVPSDKGKFTVSANTAYTVTLTLTLGESTKTVTFTVTGERLDEEDTEGDHTAIVRIPLATQMNNSVYGFGKYKVEKLENTVLTGTEDTFTLSYTVTPIDETDADYDTSASVYFNGFLAGSDEANALATIDEENKILFKEFGEYEIKVVSNVDKLAMAKLKVNYNTGYNAYNIEDMYDVFNEGQLDLNEIRTGVSLNVQTDIIFDETADPFTDMFISIYSRTIYGNNHVIDASKVPAPIYAHNTGDADRNLAVINIIPSATAYGPSTVLRNLTVKANGEYNKTYNADANPGSPDYPKNALCGITIKPIAYGMSFENDAQFNQFDYATRRDGLKVQISSKHNAFRHSIEYVTLENISVSGTLDGIRLQNIESLTMKNVSSRNSFLHNMEVYQVCDMTLENTTLGYSGGAAIEFKEDYSKTYLHRAILPMESAWIYGGKPVYMPADAYNATSVINDDGYFSYGQVLMANSAPKLPSEITEDDEPYYITRREDNKYVSNMNVLIKGTFVCDNWTAGNEVYYMTPSGSPDSSNYIITGLKSMYPNRVKKIDGVEKINFAMAVISWSARNYTNITFEGDTGFSAAGVELQKLIPNAGWAYNTVSPLYVNDNL